MQVVIFAGILLLGIVSGWAQQAKTQNQRGDAFASVNDSLSAAADRALAAPFLPSTAAPKNDSPLTIEMAPAISGERKGQTQAINRVQQLRPTLEPILREEGVPTALTGVVLVESGGQPNALSPKGALGIWQFMPDTARRYGLVVRAEHDERLDIQRSTRAAARYLRDLYGQFGDWQLALAAYNAGEHAVQTAINRHGTRDFSELSSGRWMPLETRKYVPAVLEATKIFTQPDSAVGAIRSAIVWKVYASTQPIN